VVKRKECVANYSMVIP